jgi:hypothetical protein
MLRTMPALVAAMLTGACSALPPTSPSTSVMSAPTSVTTKWHAPPTALVCRVADDVNGTKATYYLQIHSAALNFSPCDSGIARISIHIGDPSHPYEGLAQGLQQRCMYNTATDHSVKGTVQVISTAEPANLDAANELCLVHHGLPY